MHKTLVIACGAIAHELVAVKHVNGWHSMDIECLPAHWHNTPHLIVPGVKRKIEEHKERYHTIFVAYGDCGTGGLLDDLLNQYSIDRLPGDHCYSFFAGEIVFNTLAESELGTFYLTDYLVDNFKRLVLDGCGISQHPELRDVYFGNYTRLLYLAQDVSADALSQRTTAAQQAANDLNLSFEIRKTGLEPFQQALNGIPIIAA